jgi:hypothetical protein
MMLTDWIKLPSQSFPTITIPSKQLRWCIRWDAETGVSTSQSGSSRSEDSSDTSDGDLSIMSGKAEGSLLAGQGSSQHGTLNRIPSVDINTIHSPAVSSPLNSTSYSLTSRMAAFQYYLNKCMPGPVMSTALSCSSRSSEVLSSEMICVEIFVIEEPGSTSSLKYNLHEGSDLGWISRMIHRCSLLINRI